LSDSHFGNFVAKNLPRPSPTHLFLPGCQFHPEFKSKPLEPHPIFRDFIAASYRNHLRLTSATETESQSNAISRSMGKASEAAESYDCRESLSKHVHCVFQRIQDAELLKCPRIAKAASQLLVKEINQLFCKRPNHGNRSGKAVQNNVRAIKYILKVRLSTVRFKLKK
jgi:Glutamine amidotransferase class-I